MIGRKYLDATVRVGTTPIAVELKAMAKWDMKEYRTAFIQAVPYRHFIQQTPALDPWFQAAGMDRRSVLGVVAFPGPPEITPDDKWQFACLQRVGSRFGIRVMFVQERH